MKRFDGAQTEGWGDAEAYERFVVRWSRPAAWAFLRWLDPAKGLNWLDVGCGTGELSRTIVSNTAPNIVIGVDRSEAYVERARRKRDQGIEYRIGDAQSLPFEDGEFGAVVSGLVMNFVSDPARAVAEKVRVARTGGTVGGYVWDYSGGMDLIVHFLAAAEAADPSVVVEDAIGYAAFDPPAVIAAFQHAGAIDIVDGSIEVETHFRNFDEVWAPMLGGQGPIGQYLASLGAEQRADLRNELCERMPTAADGSIRLKGRAWTVSARKA